MTRARRKVILEDVRQEMVERDKRDSSRDTAPLKPADDAVTVETSDLDPDEVTWPQTCLACSIFEKCKVRHTCL